jgi:hypothetical protein
MSADVSARTVVEMVNRQFDIKGLPRLDFATMLEKLKYAFAIVAHIYYEDGWDDGRCEGYEDGVEDAIG